MCSYLDDFVEKTGAGGGKRRRIPTILLRTVVKFAGLVFK